MTPYKEIVFAAMILFAPHIGLQLAVWIVCGLIGIAFLASDALANTIHKLRRSMSHYD